MSILQENLTRYRKFFMFLIKYWNSDVVQYTSDKALGKDAELESIEYDQKPEEFAQDLKNMGPTYIKLGQLLSTRPDLLPEAYLAALASLQDDVDPIPNADIHKIFEDEVGTKISKAFQTFEETPMASASIGQVHVATLHSGKKVAVKIQRPGIRKKFIADLDTLEEIAKWASNNTDAAKRYNVRQVVEELRYILLQELDYALEAQNLITLKSNLEEFKYLFVPEPILDFSTSKILTMEFVEGKKVTKISPLKRIEEELSPMVDELIKAYLQQIIIDGFAHGDPHPGNIHITQGNQLALMDLGMVVRFPKDFQDQILQLMIGLSSYNSSQVSGVLLTISQYDESADIENFKKKISRLVLENQNQKASNMQTGRMIIQLNRVAAQNDIQIPVKLHMLAKILLNMDQIVAVMAPDYDINKTIKDYVQELMQSKMKQELKPENLFNVVLETKKLAEKMPDRLNAILENLATNNFKVKVDAMDDVRFTDAFQKVANRITLGIIIGSLIMGAALLIQIPTDWKIMGYPGLAIILFLLAACLGFYIVYEILFKDEKINK